MDDVLKKELVYMTAIKSREAEKESLSSGLYIAIVKSNGRIFYTTDKSLHETYLSKDLDIIFNQIVNDETIEFRYKKIDINYYLMILIKSWDKKMLAIQVGLL